MVIKYCRLCNKIRKFSCPAEERRRNKNNLCRTCWRKNAPKGKDSPNFKRGSYINDAGYILVLKPDHPHATALGYVREHRLVMEQFIGRSLGRNEVVHHINGIKNDNRIENLELMKDTVEHHREEVHHPWLTNKKCSLCTEKHLARGYCGKHYWIYFLKNHRASK